VFQPGRRGQFIILILAGALLFGAGVKYAQLKESITGDAGKDILVVEQSTVRPADDQFITGDQENLKIIKVHIFGEVKNSGVYEIEEDARVIDAVEKAGPTEDADLDAMSLAAPVMDGQDIYVPSKREGREAELSGFAGIKKVPNDSIDMGRNSPFLTTDSQKININTATKEELESLPGIGPVLAGRIVEYRQANGSFISLEDIKNVSGIGDAKFKQLKDKITLY